MLRGGAIRMGVGKSMRPTVVGIAVLAVLGFGAFAAAGAEQTREGYVAQVEPICKANFEASSKILKGVRGEIREGKLKPAAAKFSKAAAALRKTLRQLRAVPQPPADAARLGRWLDLLDEEAELLGTTATKLRKGDKFGAEKMAVRLTHTANRANNEVLEFEFHYCATSPSQFT
jgi:hypothetical protein